MSIPSPPTNATYVPYQAYKSKRHSRNLSNSNHVKEHPPISFQSLDLDEPVRDTNVHLEPPLQTVNSPPIENSFSETLSNTNTTIKHDAPPEPSPSRIASKKTSTIRRLHHRDSSRPQSISLPPTSPSSPRHSSIGNTLADVDSTPVTPAPSDRKSILAFTSGENRYPTRHSVTPPPLISTPSLTVTAPPTPDRRLSISEIQPQARHHTPSPLRKPAPYPPGFQPKGVYRPLTDEFLEIRRTVQDSDGIKSVERTKLERRLEKLIKLHFSHDTPMEAEVTPSLNEKKRSSTFFDFNPLKSLNINEPGDLWRGVLGNGTTDTKSDVRATEQRITPWQDDAAVAKCPLCSAVFHPLTNRKHHCRLCGKIICSLPIKPPQRIVSCSILFVVDVKTGKIEEVGEGVDYGVRRRSSAANEEDKFLKGVRICRNCRPVLLKQQYYHQITAVPPFAKLYENFIGLEKDIEGSLPKFQELLMSLNHLDQPTKEASAARKRLLDSFAQYDKLAKLIRALPCPNGLGSSQDRVQAAIQTRATLFLQKNMFPLQSLPTPKTTSIPKTVNNTKSNQLSNMSMDADSALALSLQPLIEQESLLESFVEEARAQRKFEDVKTLKANLVEIRREIEKVLEGHAMI